ncbi:MAG: GDSL-type esterase/lipase family protein, partial [Mariniblastus sp.]
MTAAQSQPKKSILVSATPTWDGKETAWKGYARFDFQVDGKPAYVVRPKTPAPGNPWIWRARFPGFHAEADLILLERGFHIARINTDGMLGSPKAITHWDAFYQYVTQRGLAKRCALEGVSRGGLFVYNFAAKWPQRVACIYCDTPVCDINSWPGGKGSGRGDANTWQRCLAEYGLTEPEAKSLKGPLHNLKTLADAKIPILHIVSLNDQIVPPTENTFLLAEKYKNLGGTIDIIKVEKGTDKSSGHHFTHPDPIRVADFIERNSSALPSGDDYFTIRGDLHDCFEKFKTEKTGRVVFLGGSITTMKGWRDHTADYLRQKFPETKFEFIDAGISSTGSTPAAFRLTRDVLSKGDVDLLFEEAAVNDLHNGRSKTEMIRGMEGILRQAKTANPKMGVVVMHFIDPKHLADYRNSKTPVVIEQHEKVAAHYQISTINLAKEVTDRIVANQFDWRNDFKNCHPSPMGHRLYVSTIRRFLDTMAQQAPSKAGYVTPAPLDGFSYDKAKMVPLDTAKELGGFQVINDCDPRMDQVGGNVRPGFHNVSMLIGSKPGVSFSRKFTGRAIGIFTTAGPDA